MPLHTYDDAVAFLLGRINYERHPSLAHRDSFKLDRVQQLLARLGNPQEQIPAVHLTGTKGKGSTATMTAAALSAAGIRTGLYTSPHLERLEERMRVNGEMPSADEFVASTNRVANAIKTLDREDASLAATFFEAVTAVSWDFFRNRGVELVVLEVGLGGRLDATNVCRPEVVAITNISRDHTALLGDTPAEIAFEKAGIIKPGVPCVSGVTDPEAAEVVRRVCRERHSPLTETSNRFEVTESLSERGSRSVTVRFEDGKTWGPLPVPLAGRHQADNAALALHLLDALAGRGYRVGPADVAAGWTGLKVPARVEIAARRPTIVIDAAHNVASAEALVRTLTDDFSERRRILLFAGSREKDVAGMLQRLAPAFDAAVLTAFHNSPRATPPEALLAMWNAASDRQAFVFDRSDDALNCARRLARADDLVCITGSFFLAAELRPLLAD